MFAIVFSCLVGLVWSNTQSSQVIQTLVTSYQQNGGYQGAAANNQLYNSQNVDYFQNGQYVNSPEMANSQFTQGTSNSLHDQGNLNSQYTSQNYDQQNAQFSYDQGIGNGQQLSYPVYSDQSNDQQQTYDNQQYSTQNNQYQGNQYYNQQTGTYQNNLQYSNNQQWTNQLQNNQLFGYQQQFQDDQQDPFDDLYDDSYLASEDPNMRINTMYMDKYEEQYGDGDDDYDDEWFKKYMGRKNLFTIPRKYRGMYGFAKKYLYYLYVAWPLLSGLGWIPSIAGGTLSFG